MTDNCKFLPAGIMGAKNVNFTYELYPSGIFSTLNFAFLDKNTNFLKRKDIPTIFRQPKT